MPEAYCTSCVGECRLMLEGLTQAELERLIRETKARDAEERAKKDLGALLRQLDGLIANTMRSVQALEGRLTADEHQGIVEAIEKAKKAKVDGNLDDLCGALQGIRLSLIHYGHGTQRSAGPKTGHRCSRKYGNMGT
jgi:hypothetical protein